MPGARPLACLLALAVSAPLAASGAPESSALLDVLYAADALGLGAGVSDDRAAELDALSGTFSGAEQGSLRRRLETYRVRSLGRLRALARLLPRDVQEDIVELYRDDPRYQDLRGDSPPAKLAEMVLRDLRRIVEAYLERVAAFDSLRELSRWRETQRERVLPFARRLRLRFGVYFVALEQALLTPAE